MNTKFVHKANKNIASESLWRKFINIIIGGLLFALIKAYFFIPVLIDNMLNIIRKAKISSSANAPENRKELDFGNLKYSNKTTS